MRWLGYLKFQLDDAESNVHKKALKNAGCTIIFKDSAESLKDRRSGFDLLLSTITKGDCVVVYDSVALGSSLTQFLDRFNAIQAKGADVFILDEGIKSTSTMSFSESMALVSQIKERMNEARTKPGRNSAKARGMMGGRPEKISDRQTREIKRLYLEDIPIQSICERLKISRPTLYKYLKR